jgi:Ras-related protein Rab-5C
LLKKLPMLAHQNPAQHAKLVMIGPHGCGKTAIASRIVHDTFCPTSAATVGAAYLTKQVEIEGTTLRLDIWDTGGSEKYRSLVPMYYHEADAAVIVFDVTVAESLPLAHGWIEELRNHARKDIILIGVANKIDLTGERAISENEVDQFGFQHHLECCMEVSAKTGQNIRDLSLAVCRRLAALPFGKIAANQIRVESDSNEVGKCKC